MSRRRSRITEKRSRRAKDDVRALHKQGHDFDRILGLMGLSDLRIRFHETFTSTLPRRFPRPRVVPDPALALDDDLRAKAEELRRALERVTIRVGHGSLSHADFFTFCIGLYHLIRCWERRSPSPGERREWGQAGDRLSSFIRRHEPEIRDRLYEAVRRFLAFNNQLDGPIYTIKHRVDPEGAKMTCTMTVGRTSPEVRSIEIGGVWRRAFRCGAMKDYGPGEFTWISWDAGALGADTNRRLPVYAQSHAIAQAYKRIGAAASDRSLHHLLAKALCNPQVTPVRNGDFLVAVTLGDERIGYLVAQRLDDVVLVKTFLLITMQGTPEGDNLHRRLMMRRADLEYLELDNFRTLFFSDLLKDDVIAGIFRESGCEGLLALARREHPYEIRGGYADRFKTYFDQALASPFDAAGWVPHPAFGEPILPSSEPTSGPHPIGHKE